MKLSFSNKLLILILLMTIISNTGSSYQSPDLFSKWGEEDSFNSNYHIDRDLVEANISNAIHASEGTYNGSVKYGDIDISIDIYRLDIPEKRFLQDQFILLILNRTSNDDDIINMLVLFPDYSSSDDIDHLSIIDEGQIEINTADKKTDHMNIVIYGNGNYTIDIIFFANNDDIRTIYGLMFMIALLILSLSVLLTASTWIIFLLIEYIKRTNKNKDTSYGRRIHDDEIENYLIKNRKKKKIMIVLKLVLLTFLYAFYFLYMIFYSLSTTDLVGYYKLFQPFIFIILAIISFPAFMFFLYMIYEEKRAYDIMSRKPFVHKKPSSYVNDFKERIFLLGDLPWYIAPYTSVIFLAALTTIIMMKISTVCIIINLLYYVIIIFIMILLCHRLNPIIICNRDSFTYSTGPKWIPYSMKIHKRSDIFTIRPMTTSGNLFVNPGMIKVNGKWQLVRTCVAIVLNDGTVNTYLTSRPMDVIALLGEDRGDINE